MSFLESISRAVGIAQAPTSTVVPPNPPAGNMNFQPAPTPQGQSAPAPGATSPTPTPAPAAQDPVAIFGKMFDNTPSAEAPPAFTLDPAQLSTVANGQDFTQGVDPELLTKANSGDSAAMVQVMQQVSRNAYKAAMAHTTKLTESFVGAREGFSAKSLGTKIREELTVNALADTPNFTNPGIRKLLVNVAKSIEHDHPDATPEQIANMARQAVQEAAQAVNPTATSQTDPRIKKATNWDEYFDS